MGTGWRRAFCTTIPKDKHRDSQKHHNNNHPSNQQHLQDDTNVYQKPTKLSIFSTSSNPTTPRLHTAGANVSASTPSTPTLRCRTFPNRESNGVSKSSNPASPRSPFTAILKNTLRLSKNGCGVCTQSVKTGQGTAIYTAECSHAFHFPCIASHVRKQGTLICPVCNVTWKDVPLLSFHKNNNDPNSEPVVEKKTISSSAPATPTGLNRVRLEDKRVINNLHYNDDEPLLMTVTEDPGEFQGFFVPPPGGDHAANASVGDIRKVQYRNVEVKLLPEAAVVSANASYETYAVALRVKAPPATAVLSATHRAPVDLVTVLDCSGSMAGPKLLMLKKAMRLVISSLGSSDRLSIVAFSANSQRLSPLKRMTPHGQKAARKLVDHLVCSQGTCVTEALRKAAKVLEDRREKNPVATIMLLSDGQEDDNNNDSTNVVNSSGSNPRPPASSSSSTRFAHIEIPVHSSGFGLFKGQEQDPFTKCVGGLLSVVVHDLRVQLGFASGSAQAEIMAVYSVSNRPSLLSSDSARLGDLYAEEERELLIELKVPTSAVGSTRAHHVMSVRCTYKDPVSQEMMVGKERALLAPRPHAVRSSDPRIERLRNVFVYTRAVAESRRLVDHGDYSSAYHLLSSAKGLVLQSSCKSEEYVRGLEAELAHVHWRRERDQVQREQEGNGGVQQNYNHSHNTNNNHHHQSNHSSNVNNVMMMVDENGEPLTPTSAWRAAERLAKVAVMKKRIYNRSVSDLHGFENARF